MSIRKLLDTAPLHDLIPSKSQGNYKKTCVAFSGAPRKHPYDQDKILLFTNPFTNNTKIFEFRIKDIGYIEELPNIGTDSGENLTTARVWVQRGSFGIRYEPFEVQDVPKYYEDSELLHQVMNEHD